MGVKYMRTAEQERQHLARRVDEKIMDALAEEMFANGKITAKEKALRDEARLPPKPGGKAK